MKINKIEFENFRNFRDRCVIDFAKDGNITVIYGPNGVGKTTLHQLFQWVFYGEVHFNKTASDKMYNLQYEAELEENRTFEVYARVEFEHPDENNKIEKYSISRKWIYQKHYPETKLASQSFRVLKEIDDDWKPVIGDPKAIVEKILPSGLSQYFFFDGESMIADLNQKGKDSAKSLRKALYSIFDLDVYEQALVHIGTQSNSSSTVLGNLYLSKTANSSDNHIILARGHYRQSLKAIETLENEIQKCSEAIDRLKKENVELSEKIGSTPSQAALVARRNKAKKSISTLEDAIAREMKSFGKNVMSVYPNLFISKVVADAQFRIGLKVEDEILLPGLTKELLITLLNENKCICGNTITAEERESLENYKKMFPPLSYKYIYDQFKRASARWSSEYDEEYLLKHLEAIFQYKDQISDHQTEMHSIDDELKQSQNMDALISKRNQNEEQINALENSVNEKSQKLGLEKQYLKQRKRKLDELIEANSDNKIIDAQMEIMEAVRMYFDNKLNSSAKDYSERLGESIQELLSIMLTSTRKVVMTPKFELSVRDSYGDEAKSEGQFAVVSFAYIGGIFKLLREVPGLKEKEFPLILDGPFSKLDIIQRQNVIETIPSYAPQVILFSKDDITSCFDCDMTDNIWTIYSNDERNVSTVKKGYDPEVFDLNGNNN